MGEVEDAPSMAHVREEEEEQGLSVSRKYALISAIVSIQLVQVSYYRLNPQVWLAN